MDFKNPHPLKKPLLIFPVNFGSGHQRIAPPWSRSQVEWITKGVTVLRVATDFGSRWLVGGEVDYNKTFGHERTFQRSVEDKTEVIQHLLMNPWPTHMACLNEPNSFKQILSELVKGKKPLVDTHYYTMWSFDLFPKSIQIEGPLIVLDGHHSRQAQRKFGKQRIFGWVEPFFSRELNVNPIHKAGRLLKKIDYAIEKKIFHKTNEPLSDHVFEVIQRYQHYFCTGANQKLFAADAVYEYFSRQTFKLISSSDLDDLEKRLQSTEIDTIIKFAPYDKKYILERAFNKQLFPQKSTYFYPKIPFGLFVQDLRVS